MSFSSTTAIMADGKKKSCCTDLAQSQFGRWIRALYLNPHDLIFWRRTCVVYVVEIILTAISLAQLKGQPVAQTGFPTAFYVIAILFMAAEIPLLRHFWKESNEFYEKMTHAFEACDKDHDGLLSAEEMAELVKVHFLGEHFELTRTSYHFDDALSAHEHDNSWSTFCYHYFELSSMWLCYLASLMTYDAAKGMGDANNAVSVAQGIVSVFDIWLLMIRATHLFFHAYEPQTRCIAQFNYVIFICWMSVILIGLIISFVLITVLVVSGVVNENTNYGTSISPIVFPGAIAGLVITLIIAFIVCSLGCWLRFLSCSCIGLMKRKPRHRGAIIQHSELSSSTSLMNVSKSPMMMAASSSKNGFVFSVPDSPPGGGGGQLGLQYDPTSRTFT